MRLDDLNVSSIKMAIINLLSTVSTYILSFFFQQVSQK